MPTIAFQSPPVIISTGSVVGSREGDGPLAGTFDKVVADTYYGE
ncbi:MAG: stage V sporulation protein AD, partial [Desulfotomaculaceae bacterium]|nr:stage V sporulation protein AD [Desulfotomaculaceae bacterium]